MKRSTVILLAVAAISLIAVLAWAGYNALNYTEQGGERTVIGGDLDVASGGEINVEDGGIIQVGTSGTDLNLLIIGQTTVTNGTTSKEVSITGLTSSDLPLISPASDMGSATDYYATTQTDALSIYVNTNPGKDVDFNYWIVGYE